MPHVLQSFTKNAECQSLQFSAADPKTATLKIDQFVSFHILTISLVNIIVCWQEEAPEVPLYATAYLRLDDHVEVNNGNKEHASSAKERRCKFIRTCFTQPGALPDFISRVRHHKVNVIREDSKALVVVLLVPHL